MVGLVCVVWFQLYWSILQPILASTRSYLPKPHFICGNDRCYDEEWTEKYKQLFVSSCRWAGVGKTSFIKETNLHPHIWPFSHKPKPCLIRHTTGELNLIFIAKKYQSFQSYRWVTGTSYKENNSESKSGGQMAPKPKCIAYHIKTFKVQKTRHDISFRDLTIFNPRGGRWCPKKIEISSN